MSKYVVIGVLSLLLAVGGSAVVANKISSDFNANEASAESAPQQAVVAQWAVKDAAIVGVLQNGARDGLLALGVALLAAIAVAAWKKPERLQDQPRTMAEMKEQVRQLDEELGREP